MIIDLFSDLKKPYTTDPQTALELKKLQNDFQSAQSVFNQVTDPDIIDASIYRLMSIEKSIDALLKRAKLQCTSSETVSDVVKL